MLRTEDRVVLLRALYVTMVRMRGVEETIADLLEAKEIGCPTHLYTGQEAVAAGVCAALRADDYVFGGHRSHGHYLAKGGDLNALMAELYGKKTGCSGGRGGSMHLVAPEVGVLGTAPLVAGTIPIAVGAALASALRGDGRVTVAFFGDGAAEEGVFHESMNLAAHRKLPVIFACENNSYASHMHLLERRARDNIVASAEAHGMPGRVLDGNDVLAVLSAATEAVRDARSGAGPTLLECRTYRWRGHVGPALDFDVGVRRKDELCEWRGKDPVTRLAEHLLACGMTREDLDGVRRDVDAEVHKAVTFARESAPPEVESLTEHVYRSASERQG
ncbi:MAG: thiamine pyrophosphate-dependent dehydrogenase E1 component subunit alpha [Candidatus Rokubacteria bacterium]|nr:thiamine pyrophosphate-dependent dehydrogenase E1 component subunit alpha [Candidatus Rokubacteria bacterium]